MTLLPHELADVVLPAGGVEVKVKVQARLISCDSAVWLRLLASAVLGSGLNNASMLSWSGWYRWTKGLLTPLYGFVTVKV